MTRPRRSWLLPLALFVAAALISGFTLLRGVDPFDEGLVLQAARRIGDGQIPYGDFTWAYGPGLPYLLAALGDSLLHWRIARVLVDAGIALAAFAVVRRATGNTRLAAAAWLLAVCAVADPRTANPFAYALLFALLAFSAASVRRPLLAGVLIGLAAAFRIDFALFGLAAALTVLARGEARGRRALATCAGAAVAVGALVYLPFVVAIGPADLYDALIGTSLRESGYWTLPFPLRYRGAFDGPAGWEEALEFYVPLLLVLGTVAAAVALVLRRPGRDSTAWLGAGLVVLAAGYFLYLRSRTDSIHVQPLTVALALLLPIAAAATRVRALAIALLAVLALLTLDAAGDRAKALFDPPAMSAIDLPVADGVKAPPEEARALERTVAEVDSLVPPGDPIYVLPRRSDLAPISAPLVYVLADRDNPTPRDHGLLTSAAAQREIVSELERVRPAAIVRWTDPLSSEPEPNRRGRSSGVETVDDWVAGNYTLRRRAGYYDVLVPR